MIFQSHLFARIWIRNPSSRLCVSYRLIPAFKRYYTLHIALSRCSISRYAGTWCLQSLLLNGENVLNAIWSPNYQVSIERKACLKIQCFCSRHILFFKLISDCGKYLWNINLLCQHYRSTCNKYVSCDRVELLNRKIVHNICHVNVTMERIKIS